MKIIQPPRYIKFHQLTVEISRNNSIFQKWESNILVERFSVTSTRIWYIFNKFNNIFFKYLDSFVKMPILAFKKKILAFILSKSLEFSKNFTARGCHVQTFVLESIVGETFVSIQTEILWQPTVCFVI